MMKETLNRSRDRLALAENAYTRHPRTLSLGSGIDLLGKYWARELQMGDGIREGERRGSCQKVGEQEKIEELGPADTLEPSQRPPSLLILFPPSPRQIQLSPSKGTTGHHEKTHRHVHSLPSPHEAHTNAYVNTTNDKSTLTLASDSTSSLSHPQLHRKSSKSKALSPKVVLKKSHSVKNKGLGGVEVVRIQKIVESDDGVAQCDAGRARSGTPNPSSLDGTGPVGLAPSAPECGKRKENGWSGEWNRKDMDEVVRALRELKAR